MALRRGRRRVVGGVLAAGLALVLVPAPANAEAQGRAQVDFGAPVTTVSGYGWGGFWDGVTDMYAVSASASAVRFTLPVSSDADPAAATLTMWESSFPGECATAGGSAVHMEGWTLVVDPVAVAASSTATCVAANPGSGYVVRVDAHGARDTIALDVAFRLVPGSTTTDVALPVISPYSAQESFVTAPAAVTAGGALRLTGVGGTFETTTAADLVAGDGSVQLSLIDTLTLPFSNWSEIDLRLPAVLPSGASYVVLRTSLWGAPLRTIRVPISPALEAVDPVADYVTSVYAHLFQRSPDPTGLATWTTALRNGAPYSAVSDAITSSAEFRSRLIQSAYRQYLDRTPDSSGLAFWLNRMNTGMQIQQMEAGFLASDEAYLRAGGGAQWVAALYRAVLGRAPSAEEVAFWTNRMWRGATRYDVALGFTMSTEHLTAVVDGYYVAYLGRHGERAGVAWWVDRLQRGARAEEIVAGILASQEFRDRPRGA